MSLHIFIDESGDHNLKNINPECPILVVCTCLLTSKGLDLLEKRFYEFKKIFFNDPGIYITSRRIRRHAGPMIILNNPAVKAEFYKRLNQIIREVPFRIIASVIKKDVLCSQYNSPINPYDLSLTFIFERVNFIYNRIIFPEFKKVYIIAESRGPKEDVMFRSHFENLLKRGTKFHDFNLLKHNVSLEFKKKKDLLVGLELADLCAYPIGIRVLNPNRPNPAFEILRNKFHSNGRGKISGYGIKIFP